MEKSQPDRIGFRVAHTGPGMPIPDHIFRIPFPTDHSEIPGGASTRTLSTNLLTPQSALGYTGLVPAQSLMF